MAVGLFAKPWPFVGSDPRPQRDRGCLTITSFKEKKWREEEEVNKRRETGSLEVEQSYRTVKGERDEERRE